MILWTPNGVQNYKHTCTGCTALGFTTIWVLQQGDGNVQQTVVNGVVTGLSYSLHCQYCNTTQNGSFTLLQFQNYVNTNKTNPAGLSAIERATYFGQVYTAINPA